MARKEASFTSGDGAPPGDYNVSIKKESVSASGGASQNPGSMSAGDRSKMMSGMAAGTVDKSGHTAAGSAAHGKSELPASYGDASKSGLKARVPSDSPIKFNLSKAGGT